jgi:hypothetical protein
MGINLCHWSITGQSSAPYPAAPHLLVLGTSSITTTIVLRQLGWEDSPITSAIGFGVGGPVRCPGLHREVDVVTPYSGSWPPAVSDAHTRRRLWEIVESHLAWSHALLVAVDAQDEEGCARAGAKIADWAENSDCLREKKLLVIVSNATAADDDDDDTAVRRAALVRTLELEHWNARSSEPGVENGGANVSWCLKLCPDLAQLGSGPFLEEGIQWLIA